MQDVTPDASPIGAFDPVEIIYAWVLLTKSRTVLAEAMSG